MQQYKSQKTRWRAIQTRDPDADGHFYYGVKSTGICCRPSCPSRLPKPENIEYFPSLPAAKQAGYRYCKRCRPDIPAYHRSTELIRRACAVIDSFNGTRLTLKQLATQVHSSPFHLQKSFKQILGISPRQYQESRKMIRFKNALRRGSSITAAIHDSGHISGSRIYEQIPRHLGMRPASYKKGGRNTEITYSVIKTRFGNLLIAATKSGICQVAFGDTADELEKSLRQEFPQALLHRKNSTVKAYVKPIRAYAEGKRKIFNLPLDIAATAFQWKVWDVLRAIPYAETRSYSDIAAEIGSPKSVRAVAGACSRNPVALLIPCHRVVQKNGELSGYRWGINRKAALLKHEKRT